jgi:hypothetical protein
MVDGLMPVQWLSAAHLSFSLSVLWGESFSLRRRAPGKLK